MSEERREGPFARDAQTSQDIRRLLGRSSDDERKRKDLALVEAVETQMINLVVVMQGLEAKDKILESQGVYRLTIAPGRTLPLSECKPSRRHFALVERYHAARKRLYGVR
ncbi:MAG: hypothetical protein KKB31_06615 [Nanoarchaeota archaeon]|nr:hypothetical protein [Nanoarchaeota archaeon]